MKLHQQAPFLETQLVPGVSFSLLSQVDAGNVDLAVVVKPGCALTKDLYAETLLKGPFVLIVPPDVQGGDAVMLLRDYPCIRYDRTSFGEPTDCAGNW
ncbi:LysR substrate-binding domain-containing protein [Erwinia tracheiphila]|uniref:LysR substrate-binding domain-containing protein n=1 Tax=Erwinia tracheiphila TaxID=65700 RepID=UPI000338F2FA|nr:LysR substrate-binding domain-containing protein [Erwinia tracheiphila]EOS96225.1 LysR family transcripitonal regulator [Erwinia tracheiphila PSU-1]UIA86875.1 LysR substrate-binding domain-containing protein [Erwinia tracheiphila]